MVVDTELIQTAAETIDEQDEDEIISQPAHSRLENSAEIYLRELADCPPLLTPEQEVAIAKEMQKVPEGSPEYIKLRNKFAEHNLKLVVAIAKKYLGQGLTFSDLIQEGNCGLMLATEKYDSNKINPDTGKPYRFSTYAFQWIRQAITRAISNNSRTIRLPVHIIEGHKLLTRGWKTLRSQEDRELTVVNLSKELGISEEKIYKILQAQVTSKPSSLDLLVKVDDESSTTNRMAFLKDEEATNPEQEAISSQERERLEKILATLLENEELVLTERFGLADGEEKTLAKIGKLLGISRERIRQIEEKGLKKLRHPVHIRKLKGLL